MNHHPLYVALQSAKTEEDVKDIYIKALGLKSYTKGLIDIRTDEIWFEAKDKSGTSSYAMFTQLLHYVQHALNKGEPVPPFLAVIDTQKAAIMKTADVLPLLNKKIIKWGKSASSYTKDALDIVSAHIGTHFVSYKISDHAEEFITTVKAAIKSGEIIRTQITPDNLKQVFDKWVEMIGREIGDVPIEKYALLFFADIMHDGTLSTHDDLPAELLHKNNAPVFALEGKIYSLGNKEGYSQFWAIYHRPPKAEYRNYLLERRDSLIPIDERSFKGAYYTPLNVVDKAYDLLTQTLGKNWQRDYVVWDMCCGVGNLEVKHSNPRNIFMSTLDQADVDVMRATKTCVQATRFQYDYLNDDINEFGQIDYGLTNKIPQSLQDAIAESKKEGGKKILVLINPPYAEATNANNTSLGEDAENKTGVAKTKFALTAMEKYGKASNELFTQFVARVAQEIPTATIAMFSTLKYVNAPTFSVFRDNWNAEYKGGFIVHSKAFDGLKGDFPIGFLIWKTDQQGKKTPITEIDVEVIDKNAQPIGEKTFNPTLEDKLLTTYILRPKANSINAVPLKNAVTPATTSKDLRGTKWSDGAIAWLNCAGNDLQNAKLTALLSSGFASGRGIFVTAENLWQAAVVFAVRRLIKPTWINDRDQFLQPTVPLPEVFKTDCLIWMLFNGSNLTASANNLEWNGKKWSIVNHFIPFTEVEVGAPERFESDFMVQYLAGLASTPHPNPLPQGEREYAPHASLTPPPTPFRKGRGDAVGATHRSPLAGELSCAAKTEGGVKSSPLAESIPSPLAGEGAPSGAGEGLESETEGGKKGSTKYALRQSYPPYIKNFARHMRKNPTDAEKKLWYKLKGNQMGFKFRRQFAIDAQYIADFICLEKRLIIELDGSQHAENLKDDVRTSYLESQNFRVMRFWNNEILHNLEGVCETIWHELQVDMSLVTPPPSSTPHPNPLPQGERETCSPLAGELSRANETEGGVKGRPLTGELSRANETEGGVKDETDINTLSPEAQAVLDAGRELWRAYFAQTPPYPVREEYKLNRADVGWYQIRNALKARNLEGSSTPVDFKPFETAYKALSEKLTPQVYELGFLKA